MNARNRKRKKDPKPAHENQRSAQEDPPAPEHTEPRYKEWTTVATVAVACISLIFNVIQGLSNFQLAKSKSEADQKLAEKTLVLQDIQLRSSELEYRIKNRQSSPDLEARYLVVSGLSLADLEGKLRGDSKSPAVIMQNQVWRELEEWRERWEVGDSVLDESSGNKSSHGVLVLRITNRGQEEAQKAVLTLGAKAFSPTGEGGAHLWEIDPHDWLKSDVGLADLKPGKSVMIPLGHLIGTQTYYGHVLMPAQLRWLNPTTQKEESVDVGPIKPADQWMIEALDLTVAQ